MLKHTIETPSDFIWHISNHYSTHLLEVLNRRFIKIMVEICEIEKPFHPCICRVVIKIGNIVPRARIEPISLSF